MKTYLAVLGLYALLAPSTRAEPADIRATPGAVTPTAFRGAYFMNGEIHVNTYGTPEGKPLTSGHLGLQLSHGRPDPGPVRPSAGRSTTRASTCL